MAKGRPVGNKKARAKIAASIVALMDDKGITGRAMAEKCGVRPSAVSMWRSGKNTPDPQNIKDVAKALDVTVSFLIGDRLPPKTSVEFLGRDLARRLGKRRVALLLELTDADLEHEIDRALGAVMVRQRQA